MIARCLSNLPRGLIVASLAGTLSNYAGDEGALDFYTQRN